MTRLSGSRSGRWAALLCASFAAGTAAGYTGAIPAASVLAGGALIAGALAVAMTASRRPRPALAALGLTIALLGALRGAAAVPVPGPGRIAGHLGSASVAVLGTVREATPGGGSEVIVDARRLSGGDVDAAVTGGLLVSGPSLPAVAPGDSVEVDATGLRAPDRRPGPDSQAILEREDVEAVAVSPLMSVTAHGGPSVSRAIAALQAKLVAAVDGVLPQPSAALLLGIAFGIHQPLAADVRASLQDAGLIHIVVVSGLKVVILLGLLAAAGRALQWPERRILLAAIPMVAAYVLLSGAGPAAVRSALMAVVALLARSGGRRADPLPMLALVAAAMLAAAPGLVADPGFQLSFLGTAGILLLAPLLQRRIPGPRLLVDPFAVTVAAQVATVPVMAGTFGVVALAGPVANALVLPLLPALIVVGGAGSLLATVAPALGWLPLHLAGSGADLTVAVATVLSAIPGSHLDLAAWPPAWTVAEVAALLVLVALLAARARLRAPTALRPPRGTVAVVAAATVAAVLAGVAASRPDGRLHATVLSTGSAPAVLVQTPTGGLALVDGGASPALLQQALGRVLPPLARQIGLVVVTGGERAAVAGLAGLPGRYPVDVVMAPHDLTPGATSVVEALQQAGADVVDPAGRSWTWGGAAWRCLDFRAAATGNPMCALLVADPGGSLLVLGDAGTDDQEEICAVYGRALAAQVLVAPPGGALSTVLLAIARPAVVAVPVASGAYVAPAPPGVNVDRTSVDGDLSFAGGPGGLAEVT